MAKEQDKLERERLKAQEKLDKTKEKAEKEAQEKLEKERERADKSTAKERERAEKEAIKEQERLEKEREKLEKEASKEQERLEKERERQEKEAQKAREKAEKEAAKLAMSRSYRIDASDSSHGETVAAVNANGVQSIRIQVLHASDVKSKDSYGTNPYVVGRLGKQTLRSETIEGVVDEASFREDMVFQYIGTRKLKLLVRDNVPLGRDRTLGYAKIDLDQFVPHLAIQSYTCELFNPETDEQNGRLAVRVVPAKASITEAFVEDRGRAASSVSTLERGMPPVQYTYRAFHLEKFRLTEVDTRQTGFDTFAPYMEFVYGRKDLRSSTFKGFQHTAEYLERHSFATSDFSLVKITCFNNIRFAIDRPLGKAILNVADLSTRGAKAQSFRVELKDSANTVRAILEGRIVFDDAEVKRGAATVTLKDEVSDAESALSDGDDGELKKASSFSTTAKSFILEIVGGAGLHRSRKNDILQPYVKVFHGRDKLKTRTVLNGGGNPQFGDKCVFPYHQKQYVVLHVKDNAKRSRDVVVGAGKINLEEPLNRIGGFDVFSVPLKTSEGEPAGSLSVRLIPSESVISKAEVESIVPAKSKRGARQIDTASTQGETPSLVPDGPYSSIRITTVCASNLKNPKASIDTLDPYVVVRVGPNELKGKVMKNAGDDPDFEDIFHFPYVHKRSVRFQVFDRAHVSKDALLGSCKVNLDTFIFSQQESSRLKLQLYDQSHLPAGYLNVKLDLLKSPVAKPEITSRVMKAVPAKSIEVLLKDVSSLRSETESAYVKVVVGDNHMNTELARCSKGSSVLNQHMRFPRAGKLMMFEAREVETASADSVIGQGFIDLSTFLDEPIPEKTYKVTLSTEGGKTTGVINVTLIKNAEKTKTVTMLSSHTSYVPVVMSRKLSVDSSEDTFDETKLAFEVPWRSLEIHVSSAKNLRNTQIFGGRMDPYLVARLGSVELKSDPLMNAGSSPKFSTIFNFPYNREAACKMYLYDYEQWREDSLGGQVKIDLAPYARYEGQDEKEVPVEISLERPGKKKSGEGAGSLKATIKFTMRSCPGASCIRFKTQE
eukprot:Protomagalhaensia_sp_Gyna_25__1140@NODE_155_length_4778_cov_48_614476_g116_i1_p1_GENE_NODE_155_length_4778_cov_48_614476_g116_i1NODE_155_length_4778_cov_48_614476_g116_i1_p1_ORF_typecomplete_len1188_score315_13C2/PF00168_30/0_0082C2/PF00168_30/1_8e08C2/PF00168_30/3C2/PF00168_30/9_9e11C2/PF00168_30/1_8e14C2/PF00168_30/1_6e03C2/PF00168_30/0_63C2/PF00168_30/1_2e07NTC2/PF10358_9/1_2e02NTC2/PF10358_9/49NTC2/PF10358_9/16NTC2/PF10358_9/6_5e02NTC2/PF10358_9/0_2NTC2/PF10358_9/2_7C2C2_1/PF11618_8/8_1e02C2